MVSLRQLIPIWTYLHLSIGAGVMATAQTLLERTVEVPLLIGATSALITAVVLLRRYPELETSVVRRFGLLTIVLFVTGHVVVADGITAPPGTSSPLTVGSLWIASMTVAYELSAGGGVERISKRLPSR